MSEQDRTKWNRRYTHEDPPQEPSPLILSLGELLPTHGPALDVAGGAGRHAIWLAQRGLDVTLVDIAPPALAIAERRARAARVSVRALCLDLEHDPLPEGPWSLILCAHYLSRSLYRLFPQALGIGGLLVVLHPTRRNLERHAKPPPRFLLEDCELPTLVEGLKVIRYEEGWLAEGRHDALLVACRIEHPDGPGAG